MATRTALAEPLGATDVAGRCERSGREPSGEPTPRTGAKRTVMYYIKPAAAVSAAARRA